MLSDLGMAPRGFLTRRRFFEQLAAVGGVSLAMAGMDALGFGFASAATAPPGLSGGAKGTKIIILGAGLAGLTAAYELGKAGYTVQVLGGTRGRRRPGRDRPQGFCRHRPDG